MKEQQKILIKSCTPKWFNIYYAVGGVFTILCVIYVMLIILTDVINIVSILVCICLSLFILAIVRVYTVIHYKTIVTDTGIITTSLFRSTKTCTWDEIIKLKKSCFGISKNFVYVILKKQNENTHS